MPLWYRYRTQQHLHNNCFLPHFCLCSTTILSKQKHGLNLILNRTFKRFNNERRHWNLIYCKEQLRKFGKNVDQI
eukprot:UN23966